MSTETTILIGISIYLVMMVAIGIYASQRTKSTADFIVAGSRMPMLICTATLTATWFGGISMTGISGQSYKEGLLGVIADPFGACMTFFVVGFFFVRLFRRLRLLTFIEFFESRFGKIASTVAAVAAIAANVGWVGAMLVAFGTVFQSLTGMPIEYGIVGGAAVVLIYTAVGGMWAVAMTDLVQIIIIAVGLVILLVVVLIDVGGWGNIAPHLPEGRLRLTPADSSAATWFNYLRAWMILGVADITAQSLFQRAVSARNEQVAQNSFYLAGFSYLAMGMVPVVLGIIGSVTIVGLANPEMIVTELAINHLHPVAIAIFVGAILAAIMSSADSALLASASILSVNLLPLVKPQAPDRLRLLVTRAAIPILGAIAVYVALEFQVIFDLMLDANSVLLVCVTAPFIAGIWWRRANRTGTLASMAVGFLTWFVTSVVAPEFPGDLLGLLIGSITILVVTPLTQKADPPKPLLDRDGKEVALKNRLGTLPLFRQAS